MAGHFQHFHLDSEKIKGRRGTDQEIRFDRFYFQFEPETAKEITIGNHGRRFGMAADLAIKLPLDLGDVRDVIEMTVSEQEQLRRYPL